MNELKSDFRLIADKTAFRHPAWKSFKEAMKDRCYGRDPLNQAWFFFRDGWDKGKNQLPKGTKRQIVHAFNTAIAALEARELYPIPQRRPHAVVKLRKAFALLLKEKVVWK